MRHFIVACAILLLGCQAPSESGVGALLRAHGAVYQQGPLPDDSGGPSVAGIDNAQYAVWRGEVQKPFGGSLGSGATAALVALEGDSGYWIVTAGVPDITAPDEPTFHTSLDFSPVIPAGPRQLRVRATDREGRVGPAYDEPLMLYDQPAPDGALVITLAWDTDADLDLHVVAPSGVEIWAHHPFESDTPAGQSPADTVGYLDFDSNAACAIDGRRQENVIWKQGPPQGHYVVRVDTPSLCAARQANWSVAVRQNGAPVGTAMGQSGSAATRDSGMAGAGLLALEFDVP